MRIYKKAFPVLIVFTSVLVLLNVAVYNIPFIVFSVAFLVLIITFFRLPDRQIKPDESLIYSPADGKIVSIEEVFEDEFLKKECKKISIFMSVFNVHQNRIPVSGKVVYSKHHPGKYLVAWHPKSSVKNERHTVVIETNKGELILIRQIAGIVARRIICNVKEGDEVKQGDELGFIMFGSRVDVFSPLNIKINIELKEKTKGNITVLGHF